MTTIPRNDQTSQVCSQSQPRTRFMGVAKLPFIAPASSTSESDPSIIPPSMCSYGECRNPSLRVRPVIRAQCVGIKAASDSTIVAEQLEYECQRDRSQKFVDTALKPDFVLGVCCQRVIPVKDDCDCPRFGSPGDF